MVEQGTKTLEVRVRHPQALEFERKIADAKELNEILQAIRHLLVAAVLDKEKRDVFIGEIMKVLNPSISAILKSGESSIDEIIPLQRVAIENLLPIFEPLLVFPQVQKTEVIQKATTPQSPESANEKPRSFPELVKQAISQRVNGNLACVQCEEERTDVPFVVRPEMQQAVELFVSACVLPLLKASTAVKNFSTLVPEGVNIMEYLGATLEDTMMKHHPIYPVWDEALQKFVQRVDADIPEKKPKQPVKPEPPKKAKFGSPEYNAHNRALGVYNKALEEYNDYEPRKQAHALWQEIKSLFSGDDSSFTVQAFHDVLKMGLRANRQDIETQVSRMNKVVADYDGQHTQPIYAVSNPLLRNYDRYWGDMIVLHAFLKQGTKRNLALRNLARGCRDDLEAIQFILNYLSRHQLSI